MANYKQLDAQTKHNTKAEIQKKKIREESIQFGRDQLKVIPEWLVGKIAIAEWGRLVEEFDKNSLLSNLDYNNLGLYCNAFERYRLVAKEITRIGTYGSTGKPNQLTPLELKYSDELKKYSSMLGLTIESRLKIGNKKVDDKENDVENEFGI